MAFPSSRQMLTNPLPSEAVHVFLGRPNKKGSLTRLPWFVLDVHETIYFAATEAVVATGVFTSTVAMT